MHTNVRNESGLRDQEPPDQSVERNERTRALLLPGYILGYKC